MNTNTGRDTLPFVQQRRQNIELAAKQKILGEFDQMSKEEATIEITLEDEGFKDLANGETLTLIDLNVAGQIMQVHLTRKTKKTNQLARGEDVFAYAEVLMEEDDFEKFEQGTPFILAEMNFGAEHAKVLLQRKPKRKSRVAKQKPTAL